MTYCRRFRISTVPKTPKRKIEKPKQPQRDRYGDLTDEKGWKRTGAGARSRMLQASRRRNRLRVKGKSQGPSPFRLNGRLRPRLRAFRRWPLKIEVD